MAGKLPNKKSNGVDNIEKLLDIMVHFCDMYLDKNQLDNLFDMEIECKIRKILYPPIKKNRFKTLDEMLQKNCPILLNDDFWKKRIIDVGAEAYFIW